jgi:DNA-binding transcriptional MerR regulator
VEEEEPLVTIQELARATNEWCLAQGVAPANGQAGERITERNIRYYRARGILDAPGAGAGDRRRGFSSKHAGQLRALRVLQARAVPLAEIARQIAGRTVEELQALTEGELRRLRGGDGAAIPAASAANENWQVTAVGADYLLISRRGRPVSEEQRAQVAAALGVASMT